MIILIKSGQFLQENRPILAPPSAPGIQKGLLCQATVALILLNRIAGLQSSRSRALPQKDKSRENQNFRITTFPYQKTQSS